MSIKKHISQEKCKQQQARMQIEKSCITLSLIQLINYSINQLFEKGHEHLSWFGLVNMNDRLYDAAVGRFLSPDPYVQDPTNSQNFNRYSYALNNPLKYNDMTGEETNLVDYPHGYLGSYQETLDHIRMVSKGYTFNDSGSNGNGGVFGLGSGGWAWSGKGWTTSNPSAIYSFWNYSIQYNHSIGQIRSFIWNYNQGDLTGSGGDYPKGWLNSSEYDKHYGTLPEVTVTSNKIYGLNRAAFIAYCYWDMMNLLSAMSNWFSNIINWEQYGINIWSKDGLSDGFDGIVTGNVNMGPILGLRIGRGQGISDLGYGTASLLERINAQRFVPNHIPNRNTPKSWEVSDRVKFDGTVVRDSFVTYPWGWEIYYYGGDGMGNFQYSTRRRWNKPNVFY